MKPITSILDALHGGTPYETGPIDVQVRRLETKMITPSTSLTHIHDGQYVLFMDMGEILAPFRIVGQLQRGHEHELNVNIQLTISENPLTLMDVTIERHRHSLEVTGTAPIAVG